MEAQHAIIKRLEIKGLWGKQDFTFDFHDDLNIFTGSNGSGKTTILKVLWAMLTGQVSELVDIEMFEYAKIYEKKNNVSYIQVLSKDGYDFDKNSYSIVKKFEKYYYSIDIVDKLEGRISMGDLRSVFLPTFRRLEGDFDNKNKTYSFNVSEGMKEYAKINSPSFLFKYVSYADMSDIRNQINAFSSDIRAKLEPLEKDFNTYIAINSKILDPQLFTTQLNERLAEKQRQEAIITRPLTTFSRLIDELMLEKSVQVTDDLILGTHPNRVRLEDLSGGEKNLLSFMVYAMTQPAMMFIDEPELGMHVDWQRKFIEIMQAISPQTQYFIATHSAAVRVAYAENKFFLDDQMD